MKRRPPLIMEARIRQARHDLLRGHASARRAEITSPMTMGCGFSLSILLLLVSVLFAQAMVGKRLWAMPYLLLSSRT